MQLVTDQMRRYQSRTKNAAQITDLTTTNNL